MQDDIAEDSEKCQIDAETLSTTFIRDVQEASRYLELSLLEQRRSIDEEVATLKLGKLAELSGKLEAALAAYDTQRVEAEGRVREAREASENAIKELNKELHHDASEEHSPESVADELGRLAGVFLSVSLEEE